MQPAVAIIMRAKNEMPHARRTLEMLRRQTFVGFELFAVDSGSTDGTLEELRKHADHLDWIDPAEYVPGKVLNAAIARTGHETIVLLNADAIPLSDRFLETLLQPLFLNEADAVFGKQVARAEARFVVAYDYQRAYNPGKVAPGFFSAVACAFRRGLWEKNKFRNHGYAEDLAWAKECIADGSRFRFVAEAEVEHSHNYAFEELYRKRFRQAAAFGGNPRLGKQTCRCLREIARDCLHACRSLKPHTIPYNIAYRLSIHCGEYRGLLRTAVKSPGR